MPLAAGAFQAAGVTCCRNCPYSRRRGLANLCAAKTRHKERGSLTGLGLMQESDEKAPLNQGQLLLPAMSDKDLHYAR